jgi:hypothetical protein
VVKAAIRIGLAVLVVGVRAVAADAPGHVALRWNAPDECPDDAQLVRGVERYVGQPLAEAREQRLSISVNVVAGDGGFSAKIRFKGENGIEERSLEHPDCEKLGDAAALLVALTIDPERVRALQRAPAPSETPAAAAPEPLPSPQAPSGPVAFPARDEPVRESPRPRREAELARLGIFGFAGAGALPSVGPGLGAEASVRRAHFELGVVGRYWLPRIGTVQGFERADIRLSLVTLGVRGCGRPWLGAWQLRGCAGVDVGDLWGSGEGELSNARSRHAPFPALSGSLTLSYGRQRLAPFVGAEAMWALSRPPFGVRVNGQDYETFRSDALSIQAFVGLAYAL